MAFASYSTKPPKVNVIAVAIFFGILAGFGLSTIGSFGPPLRSTQEPFPASIVIIPDDGSATPSPPLESELELQNIQVMVARTNGFYARDYSLWLGWNNVCVTKYTNLLHFTMFLQMRYIIETAIAHGRILNRTAIIPSFVYARACEFEM